MKQLLGNTVRSILCLAIMMTCGLSVVAKDWKLVFEDEFNGLKGTLPDSTKWTHEIGGSGWGNQEHQFYTDKGKNAFLDGNGKLVIQAGRVAKGIDLKCWYGKCLYTSARLITKGKFETKYGKIEARIKLPEGQGIWPAFWMLGNDIENVGWPACGEIDILENLGHQPRKIHGTIHGPGYSGAGGLGKSFRVKKRDRVNEGFHTYSIIWSENKIEWFFDGKRFHSVRPRDLPKGARWVFDHDFFLLLNLAVGGRWPGYPDESTVFPQQMMIDYVRVFKPQSRKKK